VTVSVPSVLLEPRTALAPRCAQVPKDTLGSGVQDKFWKLYQNGALVWWLWGLLQDRTVALANTQGT
jgi:hypothetical protein